MNFPGEISNALRENKFGVSILPRERVSGGMTMLIVMILRKSQKELIEIIDSIDYKTFVSVHHSMPLKGGYVNKRGNKN